MTEGRLPILRPQEVERALLKIGFVLLRKSPGSHRRYGHPTAQDNDSFHKGKTIGRGLLRKILRDINTTAEELSAHL